MSPKKPFIEEFPITIICGGKDGNVLIVNQNGHVFEMNPGDDLQIRDNTQVPVVRMVWMGPVKDG